jgi:hypothetical protein
MVVAVLDIHMDIKPVANIKPAINPLSLVPFEVFFKGLFL